MNVIVYRRVSVDEGNGVSLDAQEARCRDYCKLYGLTVVDVITDAGESARSLDRPGMQDVLRRLKRKDVKDVIVAKLDRLSRSVKDWAHLVTTLFDERGGKQLFSVSEQVDTRTANGRFFLYLIMAIAEWERETISERTKAALKHKQAKGERTGNLPFGYRLGPDGVHLAQDKREQRVLKTMSDLRTSGLTFQAVADELNRRGAKRRHGSAWVHQAVRSILLLHQQRSGLRSGSSQE
jgi:DNA invertase Pin-like site-specific DNA recombinase